MEIREQVVPGYERVVWGSDQASGYQGIVVVHSTALGPAVGGTRHWSYQSDAEALTDGLRLARGMTYKNALAELRWGGGKSIIVRRQAESGQQEREKLFRAHGKLVDTLGGQYITAEDVGTSPADMEYILQETKHVAGVQGRSGDPSPRTARGVFRAMQAAAKYRWGSDDLAGKIVAIQGCGHVGYHLARELHRAGAKLIVSDVDDARTRLLREEFHAQVAPTDKIYAAVADIFAPCALGGILNDHTILQLRAEIVAGAANNQLLEPRHGDLLEQRGILYAPDYAANAGGVIHGCCLEMLGWDFEQAGKRIDDTIYETLMRIFSIARAEGIATFRAADRLAEERLTNGARSAPAPNR
jgi:leucine dehydrogenase